MLDQLFQSVLTSNTASSISVGDFLLCTLCSLVLGFVVAASYLFRNHTRSKGFAVTLALLPAVVQMVIMLVNGNLGAGVAVMGAFSLVRFRSVPGSAKDISGIFLAMAVGLATGMGYLAVAALFVMIVLLSNLAYTLLPFGEQPSAARELHITIPEGLDYTTAFTDIFSEYAVRCDLIYVKTCNMGSLFKLNYRLKLKDTAREKQMIDELRCRNGNLDIICSRPEPDRDAL